MEYRVIYLLLSLLSMPSLLIYRYSFCSNHFSLKGSLFVWCFDFLSCRFSLQCFVMGLCLSEML